MPADLNFVQVFYVDIQQQMHACRETEYRMLALGLLFDVLALATCSLAAQSNLPVAILAILSVGLSPLCILVTLYCIERIRRERATYEDLGRICQRVWSLYEMCDSHAYGLQAPLLEESQALRYGKGLGHLRAMMLLRVVGYTLGAMVLLVGIAAVLFS